MSQQTLTDKELDDYFDSCIRGERRATKVTPLLYADTGRASVEAERILRDAHIRYDKIVIDDPVRDGKPVPRLNTAEGFFWSLELIRWYAKAYGNDKGKR